MDTLTTDDGLHLHRVLWPCPNARGTVLIVHGLGEHVLRYAHVAARLTAAGWAVAGYDQRGHGRSDGPRGRLAAADDLLRDLARMIDTLDGETPAPKVLLGHSLGGSVAARFVAEGLAAQPAPWYRPVDGLALSSPAFDPGMNAFQKFLLAVLGPIAPNLAVHNGVNPKLVSRDPIAARAYLDDPLVHNRVAPRTVRFLVDAGRCVIERAPAWRTPTLLMYAGKDGLISPAGSRAFAASAPRAVVQVREFPEFYHELLNEPEREQVMEGMVEWLGHLRA